MRKTALGLVCVLFAILAQAQKNEISFTAGEYVSAGASLDWGTATAFEGSFAHRIAHVPLLAVSLELPVAATTSSSLPLTSFLRSSALPSFTSLFITPGVRVKLAPSFPLSPYVAVGVGLARFNVQRNSSAIVSQLIGSGVNNTWAVDFAGGLDLKIFPHVALRGELRDFYSGAIGLQSLLPTPLRALLPVSNQHNLMGTGGVVVTF